MKPSDKEKLLPLILVLAVVALDQLSKLAILAAFPEQTFAGVPVLGDFLAFIHVRNTGIAFSIGAFLGGALRVLLLIGLPLAIIAVLSAISWRGTGITRLQRWAMAGIVGGGLGNLIDRIFRPEGVVDFIRFKMYGLFGMQYFPPFNIADSAVVVCGFLLAGSYIFAKKKELPQ